jgi:uncharacterized protein
MIYRFLISRITFALENSPVVILNGPRQSGKSTLMRELQKQGLVSDYKTLDDLQTIYNLKNYTQSTLEGYKQGTVIDEIQKLPEIFSTIKLVVDQNRVNSRFVLTGSANILLLPKLSESLAGRVQILTLSPLSIQEIINGEKTKDKNNFVDLIFGNDPMTSVFNKAQEPIKIQNLIKYLLQGGYPELQQKNDFEQWELWFESYINTLLQRDVRDLADIEGLTILPNMLRIIANQAGGILNSSDLARNINLNNVTFSRYFALLESLFLVQRLIPWYKNIGKRFVKSPKIYLNDTGILSFLTGASESSLVNNRQLLGKILENLVFNELTKYISWSKTKPCLFYIRSQAGQEIDFVLENKKSKIIAIEVKSSEIVTTKDAKNIIWLKDNSPDFDLGIVLYTGNQTFEIAKDIWAMPISVLWDCELQNYV